jgi:hypothetical protein
VDGNWILKNKDMETTIFAEYDNDGNYIAFRNITFHSGSIPTENCIELTSEQHQQAINSTIEGHYKVVSGVHTYVTRSLEWNQTKINNILRAERTKLLKDSDWVVAPHSPITGSKLDEWLTYRQTLRDVPNNFSDTTITWNEFNLNDYLPTEPK